MDKKLIIANECFPFVQLSFLESKRLKHDAWKTVASIVVVNGEAENDFNGFLYVYFFIASYVNPSEWCIMRDNTKAYQFPVQNFVAVRDH